MQVKTFMNDLRYLFGLFGGLSANEVLNSSAAKANNLKLCFSMSSSFEKIFYPDYIKNVQFICIDFLEDKTELNKLWEKNCLEFIKLLKINFKSEQIFLLELYLTERYEDAGNPFWNSNLFEIRHRNHILREKYDFLKKHFLGINDVKLGLIMSYTDKYHEFGCVPEHYNKEAYNYLAEILSDKIKNIQNIPERELIINSDILLEKQKPENDHYRIDAYKNSCKYRTMRDWMYKKFISRTLDKYLIEKKYKKIAIYGMAEIGQLFLWEMQSLGIDVLYAIDGNSDMLFAEIPILKPDSELPIVDAIIVCVPFAFEDVKYKIMQKINIPIISIEELIYEA